MIRVQGADLLRPRGGRSSPPRRAFVRRALVIAAMAAGALWPTAAARADGDPASDMLLTQNVYFPYRAPTRPQQAALQRAVDDVYAHGNRVKIALIYDMSDLGSITSLYGKPADYAHFLGVELGLWYVGPLLVVMPSGFGIYDGGRSTAAEEDVLRSLRVDAATPDDLARSAATAVQHLAAADSLASPDIRAPLVTAHPASARRGRWATLRIDLFDDSGWSNAVVRIYADRAVLATLVSPGRFEIGTRKANVRWHVPAKLRSRSLRYCVVAADPARNRSAPTCAPFLRVS